MISSRLFYRYVPVLIVGLASSYGAPIQRTSVLDSSGGTYSNAIFSGVAAVGQAVPLGFSSNLDYDNYSGFLHSYVERPDLDNDMDGIADENDTDDDNDGLSDVAEITGSDFNPTTGTDPFNADSDEDGSSDGEESSAETNPLDPASQLVIIGLTHGSGQNVLEWKSRQGKSYEILFSNTISELFSNPQTSEVVTVTSGGLGPFLETTTTSTNFTSENVLFYRIKVTP